MSKSIRNIEVDEDKWKRYKYRNEDYINMIYNKYSIKRYEFKEDFMNSKDVYELTDRQKEALWEDYRHRDKLIRTGQYDDYRMSIFRDNYIRGLRRLGASEKELDILQSMDLSQWSELQSIPEPSKDSAKDRQLPPLGLFNYNDVSYLQSVREDLSRLLKERFNIDYTYDDESVISKSLKYANKLVREDDIEYIEDEDDDISKYNQMLIHTDTDKLIKTKPNKYGESHYYIRGIGSEVGKNSELIKDILKVKGIK